MATQSLSAEQHGFSHISTPPSSPHQPSWSPLTPARSSATSTASGENPSELPTHGVQSSDVFDPCSFSATTSSSDDLEALLSSATNTSPDDTSLPPELPKWADFSLDETLHEATLNVPYDFRPGPRDPDRFAPTTHIDQDRTGNYDPAAKHDPWLRVPTNCILRPKRPRPDRPFNYEEYEPKGPKLSLGSVAD